MTAADLRTEARRKGTWWDWDDEKRALEYLFYCGRVTALRRPADFARLYDLPERLLPAAALAAPTPPEVGHARSCCAWRCAPSASRLALTWPTTTGRD